jgi:hypothetical protein
MQTDCIVPRTAASKRQACVGLLAFGARLKDACHIAPAVPALHLQVDAVTAGLDAARDGLKGAKAALEAKEEEHGWGVNEG